MNKSIVELAKNNQVIEKVLKTKLPYVKQLEYMVLGLHHEIETLKNAK